MEDWEKRAKLDREISTPLLLILLKDIGFCMIIAALIMILVSVAHSKKNNKLVIEASWAEANRIMATTVKLHPYLAKECPLNTTYPKVVPKKALKVPYLKGPVSGTYDPATHTIEYVEDQPDVMLHEFTHSLTSRWSRLCFAEATAILVEAVNGLNYYYREDVAELSRLRTENSVLKEQLKKALK